MDVVLEVAHVKTDFSTVHNTIYCTLYHELERTGSYM